MMILGAMFRAECSLACSSDACVCFLIKNPSDSLCAGNSDHDESSGSSSNTNTSRKSGSNSYGSSSNTRSSGASTIKGIANIRCRPGEANPTVCISNAVTIRYVRKYVCSHSCQDLRSTHTHTHASTHTRARARTDARTRTHTHAHTRTHEETRNTRTREGTRTHVSTFAERPSPKLGS